MDWLIVHEENVAYYSNLIAQQLHLSEEDLQDLYMAALLHDVGKNKIQNNILYKNDILTQEEYTSIKKHTFYGAEILKNQNFNPNIVNAVLFHHERIDGKGYYKLKGDDINLFSKIITICDSFDSMISIRPYNKYKRKTIPEALNEIQKNLGTQFDEKLGTIFIELFKSNSNLILSNIQYVL